jgi:hypothetical protein
MSERERENIAAAEEGQADLSKIGLQMRVCMAEKKQ